MTSNLKSVAHHQEILKIIEQIPPNSCSIPFIPEIYNTYLDRKIYWQNVKIVLYNDLNKKSLYKGCSIKCSSKLKEIEAVVERLIALYDLLVWGWEEITSAYAFTEIPAKTPEEALSFILKVEAENDIWCLRDIQPETLSRCFKSFIKDKRNPKCPVNHVSSKTETYFQRLKNRNRRLRFKNPCPEAEIFIQTCLKICNSSKNKKLRQKAKLYKDKDYCLLDRIATNIRKQTKRFQ